MSREVRRVPLDYKHPVKDNPYHLEQSIQRELFGRRESVRTFTLHAPHEMFVPLFDGYNDALADWEHEHQEILTRSGRTWSFNLMYHLTGMEGEGKYEGEVVVNPFNLWESDTPDGGVTHIQVRDEDHLQELLLAEHLDEKPRSESYMPEFEQPVEQRGYVLYETVSEGTPITPIFATDEELVQYLIKTGTEWGGPMRERAARAVVRNGRTFGSVAIIGGNVLNSTDDADVIEDLTRVPKAITGE